MVQSSNLTLSFSSESSIEEELKRESTADVITIVVRQLDNWTHMKSRFIVWVSTCELNCLIILTRVINFSFLSIYVAHSCLTLYQVSYLVMFAYVSVTLGDAPRLSSFYLSSKVWFYSSFKLCLIFIHLSPWLCACTCIYSNVLYTSQLDT